MTLNDVMAVYCVISLNLVNTCVPTHNRVDLWRNFCTNLLYFVVRGYVHDVVVKMSFLFYKTKPHILLNGLSLLFMRTIDTISRFFFILMKLNKPNQLSPQHDINK